MFPDAPNKAHFPGCVLGPGERYRHEMQFRFPAEQHLGAAAPPDGAGRSGAGAPGGSP